MTGRQLKLLVAGHTNTGKTSMLRTLGRRSEFGDVSPRSGSTRSITPLPLVDSAQLTVTAFDSPGFESAPELRDDVDAVLLTRRDRYDALVDALASPALRERYAYEVLILDQARTCDAVLYIIDAREPLLEKYLDEIYLLSLCGRPLVCLLNFTAGSSRESLWRQGLGEIGQHLVVAFDAVVYSWDAERQLYAALENVLPEMRDAIALLRQEREKDNDWRIRGATHALAEALIELAACEDVVARGDTEATAKATQRLQRFARRQEQRCVEQILGAFNYTPSLHGQKLHDDFSRQGWQRDPFDSETLKRHGLDAATAGVGGAGIGMAIDLLSGGLSLGMGTLTGLVAGGLLGARRTLRNLYLERVRDAAIIALGDAVLLLIIQRNLELVATLEQRGHGATGAATPLAPLRPFDGKLPRPVLAARDNPAWSGYQPDTDYRGWFEQATSMSPGNMSLRWLKQKVMASLSGDVAARERAVASLQAMITQQIHTRHNSDNQHDK